MAEEVQARIEPCQPIDHARGRRREGSPGDAVRYTTVVSLARAIDRCFEESVVEDEDD